MSSSANSPTSFAPTRDAGAPSTLNVRVTNPQRALMISPLRASCAGLLGAPFTSTCPALIDSAERVRVLNTRTAQSH